MHGYCTRMIIIIARRSYASAVLGVVILFVCPSVVTRVQWLKYTFGGPGTLKKFRALLQLKGPLSTCLYH